MNSILGSLAHRIDPPSRYPEALELSSRPHNKQTLAELSEIDDGGNTTKGRLLFLKKSPLEQCWQRMVEVGHHHGELKKKRVKALERRETHRRARVAET